MSNRKVKRDIDRRSFLRSTAAAGAGLILSPSAFGRSGNSKADDINVALIGLGTQGRVLLVNCLKIDGIRIKAVCDIWENYSLKRASGLLKKYDHRHNKYIDYREMLSKEDCLDAVIIATPDFCHADQTVESLKKGLHVYCEKVMSNTIKGAQMMVKVAKDTSRLLQIGHQRRSNPVYIHCFNKLIKKAKITGKITTVNGQWNKSAQPELGWPKRYPIEKAILEQYGYESMEQFCNWRLYKRLGAGPITDLGSHQIDVFSWFLDAKPISVIASGGVDYYESKTDRWYDTVMAVYEYKVGGRIIRTNYQVLTTNSNGGYFEKFMGDKGTIKVSELAGNCGFYREPSSPDWSQWVDKGFLKEPAPKVGKEILKFIVGTVIDVRETVQQPAYEMPFKMKEKYHKPHLENFFDAVRNKAKLNCPAEVGYQALVASLKVNDAIEKQRKLNFDPDEFEV